MKVRFVKRETPNMINNSQKWIVWQVQIETSFLWGLIKYWRVHASFHSLADAENYYQRHMTGPDIVEAQ